MGKTTFLRQALAGARGAGFATHLVEAGDSGAGRNTEVVRGVLAAFDADGAGRRRRTAWRCTSCWATQLDAAEAALAAALDPEARAQAHVRAVEALVAAAEPGQARVLAIEDLHWCDAETTRILCAVARAPGTGTGWSRCSPAAPGEEPADLAWSALLRPGSLTSIDLGPLAPEDAARLAARYAARSRADPPLPGARRRPSAVPAAAAGERGRRRLRPAVGAGGRAGAPGRVPPAERRLLEGAAVMAASFSLAQMVRLVEHTTPIPARPWRA